MVKKGVAKIINTENNKVYIISSCKKNIDDHIEGVMSELENGCRNNPKLQNDYNNNPEAFKSEIIHIRYGEEDNQELNNEINRLQAEEVYKYKDNKYNRRTGNVSYEGGNTNPFTRKGLNENEFVMTDFMERLFASLNKYNLSQESKNIIKEKNEDTVVHALKDLKKYIQSGEREVVEVEKTSILSKILGVFIILGGAVAIGVLLYKPIDMKAADKEVKYRYGEWEAEQVRFCLVSPDGKYFENDHVKYEFDASRDTCIKLTRDRTVE